MEGKTWRVHALTAWRLTRHPDAIFNLTLSLFNMFISVKLFIFLIGLFSFTQYLTQLEVKWAWGDNLHELWIKLLKRRRWTEGGNLQAPSVKSDTSRLTETLWKMSVSLSYYTFGFRGNGGVKASAWWRPYTRRWKQLTHHRPLLVG